MDRSDGLKTLNEDHSHDLIEETEIKQYDEGPAYSDNLNKNYMINLIQKELDGGADSEQILSIFVDMLIELKKEEENHVNISLFRDKNIRSAFACAEAHAAFELLKQLITRD